MFQLDQAIAEWRQQLFNAGIKSADVLDEMESHLREDVERQEQGGSGVESAFQAAVRRLGQSGILTEEFSKIGETTEALARLKYFFQTLVGIQKPILANNMNSASNPEPAWATYLKSSVFAMPAALLWLIMIVFVYPKFNEVLLKSDFHPPAAFRLALDLALFVSHYSAIIGSGFIAAVALAEWRVGSWPNYRRAVFGAAAFLLNSAVLMVVSTMVVLSLCAGDFLAKHAK